MPSVIDELDALVAAGGTPSFDQLGALARSTDLVRIGMLADQVRRRRHGAATTFVRVCDVAADAAATATWPEATGELKLVGAPVSADHAVAAASAVVGRANGTPVTAWALEDLEQVAGPGGLGALVERLHRAGIAAVAQASIDRLADPVAALSAVVRGGSALARLTVDRLDGPEAALDLFRLVRATQRATGAIRVFAPLPRQVAADGPSTGYDDAKVVALARLSLDAVESIQVDWRRYGPKLAQVALLFGADDIDAVAAEDDQSQGRRRAPLEEVRRNIVAASLSPVERDGRWSIVSA